MEASAIQVKGGHIMTEREPTPESTEVTDEELRRIARVALFDTVIDYHHRGHCTFEEAMAEFHLSLKEQGIEYA